MNLSRILTKETTVRLFYTFLAGIGAAYGIGYLAWLYAVVSCVSLSFIWVTFYLYIVSTRESSYGFLDNLTRDAIELGLAPFFEDAVSPIYRILRLAFLYTICWITLDIGLIHGLLCNVLNSFLLLRITRAIRENKAV